MPRLKIEGIEKLNQDILESVDVNEDQLIKLSVLESFCQHRGIKMKDLNRDILESFNINVGSFLESAAVLESGTALGSELEKIKALNACNPLLTLNSLHRAGKSETAAFIQRHYLDFMEAANDVLEKDVTIMESNLKFIDDMYTVFQAAIKE